MRDYDRSPDTLKIWEMSLAGASSREIETELNFKFGKINSAVRRGRDAGVIPRPSVRPISSGSHHKNYMRLGNVSAILDALSEEQVEWLATEARKIKCESLSEYIVEIIRDAHANEELTNE
jgi:hypothetical protein